MDKPTPARGPDLFSVPRNGNSDSRRILAGLENGGKTQSPSALLARMPPRRLALALAALAVLAAALACAIHSAMATRHAASQMAPPRSQPGAAQQQQQPQPQAPAAIPPEAPPQVAAIVSEPWQAALSGQPVPAGGAGFRSVPAATPAAAVAALQPGRQAKAAHDAVRAPPAIPEAEAAAQVARRAIRQAAAHAQAREAAQTPGDRPAGVAAAATPGLPAPPATQDERDVALLSALLAHGLARQPAATATGNNGERAAVQQDPAERREGEPMEAALRRCRGLDSTAASLCRARACGGRWLHEAACRVAVDD